MCFLALGRLTLDNLNYSCHFDNIPRSKIIILRSASYVNYAKAHNFDCKSSSFEGLQCKSRETAIGFSVVEVACDRCRARGGVP